MKYSYSVLSLGPEGERFLNDYASRSLAFEALHRLSPSNDGWTRFVVVKEVSEK